MSGRTEKRTNPTFKENFSFQCFLRFFRRNGHPALPNTVTLLSFHYENEQIRKRYNYNSNVITAADYILQHIFSLGSLLRDKYKGENLLETEWNISRRIWLCVVGKYLCWYYRGNFRIVDITFFCGSTSPLNFIDCKENHSLN